VFYSFPDFRDVVGILVLPSRNWSMIIIISFYFTSAMSGIVDPNRYSLKPVKIRQRSKTFLVVKPPSLLPSPFWSTTPMSVTVLYPGPMNTALRRAPIYS
jgi:hypothetical protein